MILSNQEARKIINLNPKGLIDIDIAERQFEVILKGFNHLNQSKNNFLYIADEVGLGKTYVALGIASLLRHFSSNKEHHKDCIIVPKKNLQLKWKKEIRNFISNNYLLECNIVKTPLGTSVGLCEDENIHPRLEYIHSENPSYEIFRNTSFSISASSDDWKLKLFDQLPESVAYIFKEAIKRFRYNEGEVLLRRLYAYLLNITMPKFDLLIVDEAHNFKHGTQGDVSYRNQVVSRLMGVAYDEDEVIFNEFPELKGKLKPLSGKVILLSATPLDNGVYEIANQLDCFLPKHPYRNLEAEVKSKRLKEDLGTFMIRGVMNIKLSGESMSRNRYRHEHRNGNVLKEIDAPVQTISDPFDAAMVATLQLKTLEQINTAKNNSFEIGMLAGFESFKIAEVNDKEFEDSNKRDQNKSVDANVISSIANSYYDEFKKYLPHPKQDNLVTEVYNEMLKGNKSLIFVRRIASVNELEKRLIHLFEENQAKKIYSYKKQGNKIISKMLKAFYSRKDALAESDVLDLASSRLKEYHLNQLEGRIPHKEWPIEPDEIKQRLIDLLDHVSGTELGDKLDAQLKGHLSRTTISSKYREMLLDLIHEFSDWKNTDELADGEREEPTRYFFLNYFSSKQYIEGYRFKKRLTTKNWFRYNYFYLTDIAGISINNNKFNLAVSYDDKVKTEANRIDFINERILESFTTGGLGVEVDESYKKRTFFNCLFDGILHEEFQNWVDEKWKSSDLEYLINELNTLQEIIRGVFRNGSGLLPCFIADSHEGAFEEVIIQVLKDSFPEVIEEIRTILIDFDKIISVNFSDRSKIRYAMYNQSPVVPASGDHSKDVSGIATQFRMPGFPYVVITTDVLKEGEDLHTYCSDIYHYGIAWNPSDMEQRTGRIDRINSKSYFKLKEDKEVTFDNSLHVFYPYLSDTLEVNQVAKVFKKMNGFIDTFYDVTIKIKKESTTSSDEIVSHIPPQIKKQLSSKYDFDTFKIEYDSKEPLKIITGTGVSRDDLKEIMLTLKSSIESSYDGFAIKPKLSLDGLRLSGNVIVNKRRGPFKVTFIKGKEFSKMFIVIDSIISKSAEIRRKFEREEIQDILSRDNLTLVEENELLLARGLYNINTDQSNLLLKLQYIIEIADEIEGNYTGDDLIDNI
jgi:hypothetical protein